MQLKLLDPQFHTSETGKTFRSKRADLKLLDAHTQISETVKTFRSTVPH